MAATSLTDSCKEILLQKAYERSSIKKLEEFISFGISNGVYDFEISKGLLKLYNVFPEDSKVEIIANCLILSLMNYPSIDFVSLSCLVPSKLQKKDFLKGLFSSAERLESCKFTEFWGLRNSDGLKAHFNNVKGFDVAIRNFILGAIQQTCRNISSDKLQIYLDLNNKVEFDNYINASTARVEMVL